MPGPTASEEGRDSRLPARHSPRSQVGRPSDSRDGVGYRHSRRPYPRRVSTVDNGRYCPGTHKHYGKRDEYVYKLLQVLFSIFFYKDDLDRDVSR